MSAVVRGEVAEVEAKPGTRKSLQIPSEIAISIVFGAAGTLAFSILDWFCIAFMDTQICSNRGWSGRPEIAEN